jgi:GNAT superfamily N-acetyltransferase
MELRLAVLGDLELLVRAEFADDVSYARTEDGVRAQVVSFITDGGARVATVDGLEVGAIMWRIRDLATVDQKSVFHEIDRSVFPADGCFAEIFQLWVDPKHRRRGIASALKLAIEDDARHRGAGIIYTHTAAMRQDVLALNMKLGYRPVRRGPIWDVVERISLIKQL